MKATVLKISLVVLASAAAVALYYVWQSRYSGSAKVKDQVRAVLFDPEAARFENVQAFSKTNTGCGVVNGKNRMGAYTGRKKFVVLSNGEVIFAPDDDDGTGTLETRLEHAKLMVSFLQTVVSNCPEDGTK